MANGTPTPPGLAFSRETFAKLTPGPFLQAHLKQPQPIRPNGRSLDEFRTPIVNTGSLSHSNGSAVVRVGDTAVVCGVRAELLLASDIPHPPSNDTNDAESIVRLGLLVPNVELSTGCSPNHLPGNPPSTSAQALSYRISSLLYSSDIIRLEDLRVKYTEPPTEDDLPNEGPKIVTKAYWTLYIDILCIALDGNPFDATWAAAIFALQSTRLPSAWWSPDNEMILCSPLASEARKLQLQSLPVALTFAVFSTASPLRQRSKAEHWVLADPDGFEEEVCSETVTVVVAAAGRGSSGRILRLEKSGGNMMGRSGLGRCIEMAQRRRSEWEALLKGG